MQDTELKALLSLLDDPDENVYYAINRQLMAHGNNAMAGLQDFAAHTTELLAKERAEEIVQRLQFNNLLQDFKAWKAAPHHDLLPAALLVAKFIYPNIHTAKTIFDIERLKRNIWLELNNYLTPLEQAHVLVNIVYGYFGLKGIANNSAQPDDFLLPQVIQHKKGSQTGNGLLLVILCEWLDLPLQYIPIPGQFILAYFRKSEGATESGATQHIAFFIDPVQGHIFAHHHVYDYLKKIKEPATPAMFAPAKNIQIIIKLLMDFRECFIDTAPSKAADLERLIILLKS